MPPLREETPTGPGKNHERAEAARPPIIPSTALSGLSTPSVLGPTKRAPALFGPLGDGEHVVNWHAVGHDDQQLDAGVNRLQRRALDQRRGDKEHADVNRPGLLPRFFDGVENGDALDLLTPLPGRHAGHDVGAVADHQFCARHTLAPGDALH